MQKPKIRFKGYTEDWEQCKWLDTVDISTEMVNPTSGEYDNMPHIAPGNIESFTGRILDNVKLVKDEQLISGKFRFRPDDVVYGKINPQLGKYFYASVDGLTSADAYVFNGKNGVTQKFLFALLQTEDFFKYSVSVSKRSGMPKINRDELNAYNFFAPSEKEQNKIGKILLDIDNIITLHQRKCEQIKKLKKYMLQKMFPKNEKKVPKIRFNGFTDDWEQRKVSELCCISTGKSNTQDKVEDGEYPFYVRSPIIERSTKYLYDEEAVITVGDGVGTGKVFHYVNGKYDLHQRCYRMYDFSDELNAHYFYYIFSKMFYKRVMAMTAKTSVDSVRLEMIADMKIPTPTIDEQMKIGVHFDSLNNLITLHQRRHEELIKLKKFMLKNMFI